MPAPSIPLLYNARAASYDRETSFHASLAAEFVQYVDPKEGESVLDLGCGTGLVLFALTEALGRGGVQEGGTTKKRGRMVGVDFSSGMLDVARSKLQELDEKARLKSGSIEFIKHDITNLSPILRSPDSKFDIITCCSALVLLPSPSLAIAHWSSYLKPGSGRLIVDIPHTSSMLGLKCLSIVAERFGIAMLGNRNWITGPQSLGEVMERAGLRAEVVETRGFDDVPSRTEEGRSEWGAEEGGRVFEMMVGRVGRLFDGFEELDTEGRGKAKEMFEHEWRKLAGSDGKVREEGRLWVGIGRKP